jgi:hypothetical protein
MPDSPLATFIGVNLLRSMLQSASPFLALSFIPLLCSNTSTIWAKRTLARRQPGRFMGSRPNPYDPSARRRLMRRNSTSLDDGAARCRMNEVGAQTTKRHQLSPFGSCRSAALPTAME